MAEQRLQDNQIPDEVLTETEHATLDHTGIPGVGGIDSVVAGTAITVSGTASDPQINVNIGTGGSQAAAGNHSHATLPTSDQKDALDNASAPTGANPFLTASDAADENVAVSGNDTTPGTLTDKLVAGTNITLVENNDGANETLTISAAGGATDDKDVKISSNDTTSGFLDTKLVAGTGITLTENNDGANETLTIDSTVTDDKDVKISSNDTTPGFLDTKLVAGTGITLTENNDGANETLTVATTVANTDESVKVSANDTTAAYLDTKLTAGTRITLTENNDGSNEDLEISASAIPTRSRQTATGGSNEAFTVPSYTTGSDAVMVFRNGKLLDIDNLDYVETNSTTITVGTTTSGDFMQFWIFG